MRQFPTCSLSDAAELSEGVSFVAVRFSGDFDHNIALSLAQLDERHQRIEIDNLEGLRFATLGKALLAGLAEAQHDLVAFVHEDVLLPGGFCAQLSSALRQLERFDPEWGLAGSVGWDRHGRANGHWSDPRRYRNTLRFRGFAEVDRIDEQFMLMRQSRGLRPDPSIPSIHGVGLDLAQQARRQGRSTYVIDAPTIHKFADDLGNVIQSIEDSPKIRARASLTYLADKAVSDEYLATKWPAVSALPDPKLGGTCRTPTAPIVLVGRGGGGTRLLSAVAQELGIFIGSDLNDSGDSMEMVPAVYRALFRTLHEGRGGQAQSAVELANDAADMLELAFPPGLWGFKVPESILVVESILRAFPDARIIHLVRDPVRTCLRRPHMTARTDNAVGRACLRAGYEHAGLNPDSARLHPPSIRMALTTVHQVGMMLDFRDARLSARQYLEVRFEDLVEAPDQAVARVEVWLGARPAGSGIVAGLVDRTRALRAEADIGSAEVGRVVDIVAPLRGRLGYGSTDA